MMDKDKKAAKLAKLQKLLDLFRLQLPQRLDEIDNAWQQVKQQAEPDSDSEVVTVLIRLIHSLAGSAGTFGYAELGKLARRLELRLQSGNFLLANDVMQVDAQIQQLYKQLKQGADNQQLMGHWQNAFQQPAPAKTVYLLEDDAELAAEIEQQLGYFGYQTRIFCCMDDLRVAYTEATPDVLIAADTVLSTPQAIHSLTMHKQKKVPVIFIAVEEDWNARLSALRAGGVAYFNKPLDFALLVEQLDKLTETAPEDPYRILIVDNTVLLAEHYAAVLTAAGMETETIYHPNQLLEVLPSCRPDFILMDLYMPDCSGIEAAQVVRQHADFSCLPIVYLSNEHTLKTQLDALNVCGDDFLKKPISDEDLVHAVRIRAKRFRDLHALMIHDSLTGLLNHVNLKLSLERELARCQRHQDSLCFVLLDIDDFKTVNHAYGHVVGDRVIKSLARLLSQRLRQSDIVARYGGQTFAVIFTNSTLKAVTTLINTFRENFADIEYVAEQGRFHCSFSAGIVSVPETDDQTLFGVISAAEKALRYAKQAGRNQVVTVEN